MRRKTVRSFRMTWKEMLSTKKLPRKHVRGTIYHLLFKPFLLAEIAAHNSIANSSFSLSGVSVFLPLHTRATFKLVAYNVCVLRSTMLSSTLSFVCYLVWCIHISNALKWVTKWLCLQICCSVCKTEMCWATKGPHWWPSFSLLLSTLSSFALFRLKSTP